MQRHTAGEILAVAVTSNEKLEKEEFCYCCNMCKQLLYESQRRSGILMTLIFFNHNGDTQKLKLNDMISYPWPK